MAKADDQHVDDAQMVMTSMRITEDQARSLEIVSSLTGHTKAELIREALDNFFAELTTEEALEALLAAQRERILSQQDELRQRNPQRTAPKLAKR